MASCEYGEGMAFGSEAAAGGFDPATSNRQIPAHLSNCHAAPRSALFFLKSLLYELRVLREASITSCEYYEYKKKDGSRGHGGRLRTRDLQQTNPCAPENCLAAPRSARFFLKSLLYEWLALRGRRAEDTREKNIQNSASLNRRREAGRTARDLRYFSLDYA